MPLQNPCVVYVVIDDKGGIKDMIQLTINNKIIQTHEGNTVLEAARENGINIPNFCYLKDVHSIGSCRICVVEVEGAQNLQASCMTKVREGMVIRTNSDQVRKAREVVFELMMSDHNQSCLVCGRSGTCEFQKLGESLLVAEVNPYEGARSKEHTLDMSNPSIVRDLSKCILCRRCLTMCNEVQGVGILNTQNRGFDSFVGPTFGYDLNDINCTYCGQCTTVCPTGALQEKSSIDQVFKAINNPSLRVVVQTAPAVRAALGEEFGYVPGTLVTGKMVSALKMLGFDDVFDTNFTADLTILEEGTEFLGRVKKLLTGNTVSLPMITSCSPGWIKYIEHKYPEQLEHLSSCKSPHMMLGALAKSYYARELDIESKDMYVVSIMPCTAKKYEITREEMGQTVDAVLTTRELGKMIKDAGIEFSALQDDEFDAPFGLSSGAADIFGTTGGVMEAALRTVYEVVTGNPAPFTNLHVQSVMGLESIKEGSLTFEDALPEYRGLIGQEIRFAAVSGLSSAKIIMDQIKQGKSPYLFIEIMACPGGCISGGGQPRMTTKDVRLKRMDAIYREDEGKTLRKSHENKRILELYETYLKEPNGHLSHELLHTTYVKRPLYTK